MSYTNKNLTNEKIDEDAIGPPWQHLQNTFANVQSLDLRLEVIF
jgi:hypothetical protein